MNKRDRKKLYQRLVRPWHHCGVLISNALAALAGIVILETASHLAIKYFETFLKMEIPGWTQHTLTLILMGVLIFSALISGAGHIRDLWHFFFKKDED